MVGRVTALTVIDTDVLIDVARGDAQARSFLEALSQQSSLAISSVNQMELIVGCRNKRELIELDKFLNVFQIFKTSEQISDYAVSLLTQYRLSHGLLIPDALIAATALVRGADFLSKNYRDFRFISGLNLLPYP
jgi:predicted nucleic acid-binding protein